MSSPLASSLSEVSRRINVSHPFVSTVPPVLEILTIFSNFLHYKYNQKIIAVQEHGFYELDQKYDDRTAAYELAKNVRVLCMVTIVMDMYRDHEYKTMPVKDTWGNRCNKLLFITRVPGEYLPSIKLPVPEGPDFIWAETKEAFIYVYEHHRKDADWFMMVQEDTYVVLENLRYMLSEHKSTDPVYFGCRYKSFSPQSYLSGGPGYVLSRRALTRFVMYGLLSPHSCEASQLGAESAMGICLEDIGLKELDSRDSFGRNRFIRFIPRSQEKHKYRTSSRRYKYNPTDKGLENCSDHAVSFHEVNALDMYTIDYFIYRFRLDSSE